MREFVNVPCNLCGRDEYEIYGQVKDATDNVLHRTCVRCSRCGLVWSNPQASHRTRQEFYSREYPGLLRDYFARVEAMAPQYREFFCKLGQARKGTGRFLDVGCATGHLLAAGRKLGWDVYGVELSESFGRYARETLGLQNVFIGDLWEADYPDRFFDYIHMWHTLEHVPDATRVLVEVARIMKDDGELYIGVPNISEPYNWIRRFSCWLKGGIPGLPTSDHHTYHFTPTTLRKMVEKASLVIIEMSLYYNPGMHDIADGTNWKGKLEKRLIALLAKVFHNKVGSRMSVRVLKHAGAFW